MRDPALVLPQILQTMFFAGDVFMMSFNSCNLSHRRTTSNFFLPFITLKFNPGHNPVQFGGRQFVNLNECGANPFNQRKYFPDNEFGRNILQTVKNGFFVDTGMFHQPLDGNDFHVAGAYFVFPQPGCQVLSKAAGNAERQIISCNRDQDNALASGALKIDTAAFRRWCR